jgi:hypothetical protein
MRVSDPQRFANRVTTPAGVALIGASVYIGVFTNILFYGTPITLIVSVALASLGIGCLQQSAKYKGESK